MKQLNNKNIEVLFDNLAQSFLGSVTNKLKEKNTVRIALPGGRSIIYFLNAIVQQLENIDTSIFSDNKIHLYLTDERISRENDSLNETLLTKYLLIEKVNPVFILHSFPDISNNENCIRSINLYNKTFQHTSIVFDWIFLGVGEDGHCASIFPDKQEALLSSDYYLKVADCPKPPAERVTLSKKAILEAKQLVIIFIGEEKRQAFENCNNPSVTIDNCPCKISLEHHNCMLITNLAP